MGAAPEPLGEPLGAPPHIPILVRPFRRDGRFVLEGYVCLLGQCAPVGGLRRQLCNKLAVPQGGAVLMHEGGDMMDQKTPPGNGVVLPGPARRRAGDMPVIHFDLDFEEVGRQRKTEEDAFAEEKRRRTEEEDKRVREEGRQRLQEPKVPKEAEAEIAQVLAGLPTELRIIEYNSDWGIVIEQRLREIARQAGITLQECADRVFVVSAQGILIEAFSSATVPTPKDFPVLLVFGLLSLQVLGPTHMNVQRFAQTSTNDVPLCWNLRGENALVPVEFGSDEFHAVIAYFRGTLGWLPVICSLERLENMDVYSRFKGKNQSDVTIMFHGCRSFENEAGILRAGFQVSHCRSGGPGYGIWCAYGAAYSDSAFAFQDTFGVKHLLICVVSRAEVVKDDPTMRVVGQDCAYPLWLVKYRHTAGRG